MAFQSSHFIPAILFTGLRCLPSHQSIYLKAHPPPIKSQIVHWHLFTCYQSWDNQSKTELKITLVNGWQENRKLHCYPEYKRLDNKWVVLRSRSSSSFVGKVLIGTLGPTFFFRPISCLLIFSHTQLYKHSSPFFLKLQHWISLCIIEKIIPKL